MIGSLNRKVWIRPRGRACRSPSSPPAVASIPMGRVNPHRFRHAFAREYLLARGAWATPAKLMGHNARRLRLGITRCSPSRKWRKSTNASPDHAAFFRAKFGQLRARRRQQKTRVMRVLLAPGEIRTPDPLLRRQMLYPLSYRRVLDVILAQWEMWVKIEFWRLALAAEKFTALEELDLEPYAPVMIKSSIGRVLNPSNFTRLDSAVCCRPTKTDP